MAVISAQKTECRRAVHSVLRIRQFDVRIGLKLTMFSLASSVNLAGGRLVTIALLTKIWIAIQAQTASFGGRDAGETD